MKKECIAFIKNNKLELLITFCIFSNLYPYTLPQFLYYVGLALIAYKMTKYNVHFVSQNFIYITFLGIIFLSSLLNLALDLRLILFTGILVLGGPFVTSIRWHLYKKKLMYCFFGGFATTVIVSIIAKLLNINYQVMIRLGGVSMAKYGGTDEFSGFAKFPMWNSAAAAVSIIFFTYLLLNGIRKKSKYRWLFIIMLLASIYVCIISASRSAFAFSILVSAALFYWLSFNVKTIVKYILLFSVLSIFLLPYYIDGAQRMIQKQQGQKSTGVTSRDELWNKRINEFDSSPIFGVGFAVNGIGAQRKIGRDESGGSWIAILAQTGIIGFIVTIILWVKNFTSVKSIKFDTKYILIYALFCYFTLHSILEGYMFQGGWYMCLICWMCVGILSEAQMYRKQLIRLKRRSNAKKHINNSFIPNISTHRYST